MSAKLQKNTYGLLTHKSPLHVTETKYLHDYKTRSPNTAPVKYYVKQTDFTNERLYHRTKRLHITPESDTTFPEPSQPNLDTYRPVTNEFGINYTPQMDLNDIFTTTLPELQYNELLKCVSSDSQKTRTF